MQPYAVYGRFCTSLKSQCQNMQKKRTKKNLNNFIVEIGVFINTRQFSTLSNLPWKDTFRIRLMLLRYKKAFHSVRLSSTCSILFERLFQFQWTLKFDPCLREKLRSYMLGQPRPVSKTSKQYVQHQNRRSVWMVQIVPKRKRPTLNITYRKLISTLIWISSASFMRRCNVRSKIGTHFTLKCPGISINSFKINIKWFTLWD